MSLNDISLSGLNLDEAHHETFVRLTESAIARTVVVDGSSLPVIPVSSGVGFPLIQFSQEDCLQVCDKLITSFPEQSVLLLSFASGTSPGGMYKGDRRQRMKSQEEHICAHTGLYECLISPQAASYYASNRALKGMAKPLQSDLMVYSPDVPLAMGQTRLVTVSIVSSPAVVASSFRIQRNMARHPEEETEQLIRSTMLGRIRGIFQLAISRQHSILVLGAFGCGVFANSPATIADCFAEAIREFASHFKVIVFSIVDPRPEIITPFSELCNLSF